MPAGPEDEDPRVPAGRGDSLPVRLDASAVEAAARARALVLERIADAAVRARRDPASIRLVAVTKTVPVERLLAAVAAGHDLFGENRVQEAAEKRPHVPGPGWHLIGPLQANKVRRAVELFDAIETIDSLALAARLDRIVRQTRGLPAEGAVPVEARFPVLVQVNVDADPGKAGYDPEALMVDLPALLGLGALRIAGLMTIGRLASDPEAARPTFRRLAALHRALRDRMPALGPELSMGMSLDYPVAVEEGATLVRVGQALFGPRPHV